MTLPSGEQMPRADSAVLYDQPEISKTKRRVSGPFTVKAVPSPMVL